MGLLQLLFGVRDSSKERDSAPLPEYNEEDNMVCMAEANEWRACSQNQFTIYKKHLGSKKAKEDTSLEDLIELNCSEMRDSFDNCVSDWRNTKVIKKKENGSIYEDYVTYPNLEKRVCGQRQGEPPEQCADLSCLVGECLRNFNYDFSACRAPMNNFKHCVRKLYLQEYIQGK